jgi:hypothetical protein
MRDDGVDFGQLGHSEREALVQRFAEWTDALRDAGRLRGVGRLEAGGRVVRRASPADEDPGWSLVRPSEPCVEAAAPLAVGLHVIEASDEDEASELALACPIVALGGSVEVREVRGALR